MGSRKTSALKVSSPKTGAYRSSVKHAVAGSFRICRVRLLSRGWATGKCPMRRRCRAWDRPGSDPRFARTTRGAGARCREGWEAARGHDRRCSEIVLDLANSLKTVTAVHRNCGVAEPALDS